MSVAELASCAAPYNPRKIGKRELERLVESLRTFGCVEPVVWNRRTRHIVGGHQRVKAAEVMGWDELPTYEVDLDEGAERQLNLALNKISGEWDDAKLSDLLTEMFAEGIDLELTGFSDEELERLIPDFNRTEGNTDPDDVGELPEVAHSKPGDVWCLGEHRVICGDATSADVVAKLMDGYLADMVLTDPPYNVGYVGKTEKALTIKNDAQSGPEFEAFLSQSFGALSAHVKPGAAAYIFHADTEGARFRSAFVAAGFKLSQCCVWVKPHMVLGRNDYHWQHEPCLYGWKAGKGPHRWYSDRKQTTVWTFDRPSRSEEHPTMKPVELLEYLLRNSSREGDVVLDTFGGSGSTLIACQIRGRKARVVELDPRYVDVIVLRWQEFTGEKAVSLEGDPFPA